MAHVVSLTLKPRIPQPRIGLFQWSQPHGMYVFKGKVLEDADGLAVAVNEAVAELKKLANRFYELSVVETASMRAAPEGSPELNVQSEPQHTGRRRLLQKTHHEN